MNANQNKEIINSYCEGDSLSELTIGVIGTSKKTDERRHPIHPDHFSRIPKLLRNQLVFESGYGAPFGVSDATIAAETGGVASREEILTNIGNVIIANPVIEDLQDLREGGVLWGYTDCVQQQDITQAAIDRKLTLIAFEDMFEWSPSGQIDRHTFYKNNEMAGYCAVLHALQLKGIDGHYGNQRKIIVFSIDAASRGAIYALKAHGYGDITICIQRPDHEFHEEILDCHYVKIRNGSKNEARMIVVEHDGTERPLTELIGEADILVNGIYQDTNTPTNFVLESENSCLKPNSLIIDVSCDEGMGFFFAKPTSFQRPIVKHDTVDYYAVKHISSYLWESATRSISAALIVHLPTVLAGYQSWQGCETIRRAINVDGGVIVNQSILAFQKRRKEYPHKNSKNLYSVKHINKLTNFIQENIR